MTRSTPIFTSYFYPRPPRGGRPLTRSTPIFTSYFYPRPPRGGRPHRPTSWRALRYFYPRPPRGGRLLPAPGCSSPGQFLSTPSARRATSWPSVQPMWQKNFYPRPPRGGRPERQERKDREMDFYPRPPRGGRHMDDVTIYAAAKFLSTPSARRATGEQLKRQGDPHISIHALREEGDDRLTNLPRGEQNFYPRPPRGGRPTPRRALQSVRNFYPRPPRGGRPWPFAACWTTPIFLSTPSARRATLL